MRHILPALILIFCVATSALAQTSRAAKEIRYVAKYGKYENDGKSWATAKRYVQDAINDLYSKGLQGEVWVAQGTYSPTESTESEGGSTLYMSFKVYPGITVRGGFYGLGEKGPVEGQTYTELKSYHDANNGNALTHITVKSNGLEVTTTSVDIPVQYEGEVYAEDRMMKCHTVAGIPADSSYLYETVLTGDLAQPAEFVWNDKRQVWEASFYGNCYHVVWFATNGFDSEGRAKALNIDRGTATVEGCVIQNGNARNTDLTSRYHTAYGGGAYMVKGSRLENCIVQNCEASRDGGGIYMDGGGVVRHCYIANCQALGIGVENGYGGGICIDTNYGSINPSDNIDDRMGIYRSSIVGNVGRMGGGMAIKYDKTVTTASTQILPEYLAFASAVLVANNTATTEGGGVYTKGGGAMTNMTIVRNRCNGTGVISDGIVTGRSGGLYCRDHALVLNTVLWGNACAVNNDIQYAASKSGSDVKSVDMKSCAVSQSDYTDWSTTTSTYVRGIMNYNNGEHYASSGSQPTASHAFPNFVLPSTQAGCYDGVDNGRERNTNWVPSVNSTLANAGIVSHDLNPDGRYPFTDTPYDILNKPYVSHATQGAYTREYSVMRATKVGENEYHFYVDPNAPTYRPATDMEHGKSWDEPARYLANVLYCIKNQSGNIPEDEYATAKFVIHVKEGLIDNTESYSTSRIRNVRMRLSSNTTLYGGYPAGLTGLETENEAKGLKRNPVKYPTVLTGDLMDNYETNTSHMLVFDGVSNVLVDGVQIRYLNSRSRILGNDITIGAALNMQNCRGITIRNAIIADNTAENGAAAFVLNCKNVVFENCIFHNNDSRVIVSGEANDELASTIVVKTDFDNVVSDWATDSLAYEVKFTHCNIMNNVGNALMLYNRGKARLENSMMFGNTISPISKVYYTEDTEDAKNGFGVYVAETVVRRADAGRTFAGALTVAGGVLYDEFTTIDGVTTTSTLRLRYLLNAPNLYPRFVNGIVNSGASPTGDVTFYGRATSFMPHNENPMTNGAVHTGAADTWGYDMSVVTPRTYGGLPDIGAIENYASTSTGDDENAYPGGQGENAAVYYVRTPDDGGDDNNSGLTWAMSFATITKAVETAAANAMGTGEYEDVNVVNGITRQNDALGTVDALASATYFQIHPARANNTNYNYSECWWTVSGTTEGTIVVGLGDSEPNDNTPPPSGTLFTLEDATPDDTDDANYYIKTFSGMYLMTRNTSGNNAMAITSNKANASIFIVSRQTSGGYTGYAFRTSASGSNYLNCHSNTTVGWWSLDAGGIWLAYSATVDYTTTQRELVEYADVYVAAGMYNEAVSIHEGINIYGGFPTMGNPGMTERNISNTTEGYKTIIDGTGLTQRPLTQPDDFESAETMVEGFIIQNGTSSGADMGGGVKLMAKGVLKNCRVQGNVYNANSSSPSTTGGAGIYISSGGLVKNCVIENNIAYGNGQSKYVGGAGVFADGGELQNSLIVRNTTVSRSYFLLGAGFYIRSRSQLYNCTIAYNFGDNGGNNPATGGVWDAAASQVSGTTYTNYSTFYNCIIWGNYANGSTNENVFQIGMSGFSSGGGRCYDAMLNCYSSAASATFASDYDTDANKVRNFNTNPTSGVDYTAFLDSCRRYQPFEGTWETTDFSLSSEAYQCINMGASQDLLEVRGITEDIVGSNRVIDCTVDKGAYEYSDSYGILPRTITKDDGTVDYTKAATFYVTPRGSGLASASDPGNAACAAKLQRVLDAAGRYKYQHPEQQVIVKVATYHDDDDTDGEKPEFQYYATRTTDDDDMDVRVWSIIVPRGVEVWGGYSDFYDSDSDNGFYKLESNVVTDNRDVTKNQTRFDSYYYSTDQQTGVHTYHVLTFTDKVFDGEGKPYKRGDALTGSSTWQVGDTYMSMGTDGNVTARAVVDGIFITGGKANLTTTTTTTTTTRNINSYGGAAIVTDYAHVRNCIVRDNEGIYGGALALTHNALVTGCLLDRNQADYGGAIYVFENGTSLSNGITVNTDNEGYDASSMEAETRYDYYMPRVMSSTIVNNGASVQGGGVWFKDNVRFMGVVVWQNRCQDQANVSGQYNVARNDGESYFTTEYCPFNYSVVQGIRPSGLNNHSVRADNEHGVRFYSEEYATTHTGHVLGVMDKDAAEPLQFLDFGYFHPSNYSVLTHGGMPMAIYNEYVAADEMSATDFMGVRRDYSEDKQRRFLEIGALVSKKTQQQKPLMLRLFVAKTEDINTNAALAMAMTAETASPNSYDDYYSQEGSSFAYPFLSLQDALDYIYRMRGHDISDSKDEASDGRYFSPSAIQDHANNMPFEIWMGPGTYIPSVDLSDNHRNSVANTFLIPEGVTIVGGHDPGYACDSVGNDGTGGTAPLPATADNGKPIKHFMGAYSQPAYKVPGTLWENDQYYVDFNTTPIALGGEAKPYHDIEYADTVYRIHHVQRYVANEKRKLFDINANSVVEPWELQKQTILSGQIEGAENKGVNHIVTILANQEFVGALPTTQGEHYFDHPTDPADFHYGYTPHEQGQIIALDGLTFTGGYAHGYQPGTVDDEHKLKYNHGGAILLDGNRYNNRYNHPGEAEFEQTRYMHAEQLASVGYRHIPLMVSQCKFENNQAGYGGAISTNSTIDAVNCSFEHNRAMAGDDDVDIKVKKYDSPTDSIVHTFDVKYPGAGGAIYGTYQVTGINTIFENNEAVDPDMHTDSHTDTYMILSDMIYDMETTGSINTDNARTLYPGSGGAVFMASRGYFHFMNCNFVRNQAMAYPAIYTANPNYQAQIQKDTLSLKEYNQAFNTVFWGNEIHPNIVSSHQTKDKKHHLTVIGRVVNYGHSDRGTLLSNGRFTAESYDVEVDRAPASQEDLDRELTNDTARGYTEQIWFSAYEEGRGKSPKNNMDLRDFVFDPRKHVKAHLVAELKRKFMQEDSSLGDAAAQTLADSAYQNCNILLDSQNGTSEGPNFVNPSQNAGYAGYMESADWSPARLGNLTDNGWGKVTQKVEADDDKISYSTSLQVYDANNPLPDYPVGRTGTGGYSSEALGAYVVDGAYPAIRYMRGNEKYQMTVPIGMDEYMYTNYSTVQRPMYRISMDPNPSQNQTYIDIGVYEYNHTPLTYSTEADAVDVIWVSAKEKPDNGLPDGSAWSQPTSDMQRAIETLLSSRNGHRKEIRLMDGTITPVYTIEDKLAFYIDTYKQNNSASLDKDKEGRVMEGLGVKSLTIKGGYSHELPNVRSHELYPSYIRQQVRNDATSDKWDYLFYIKDATQRYGVNGDYNETNGYGHLAGDDATYRNVYTIPIEFDGVRLINDQANEGVKGSAIHYAPLGNILTEAAGYEKAGFIPTTEVKSTPANVTTSFEQSTDTDGDIIYEHGFAIVEEPAKIIISKSHIIGSGKEGDATADASAVYLGDSHGHGILYNNVMHSNHVSPLDAECRAVTVNNTYALNGGPVRLRGAKSTLHNSVIWRNKPTANGSQFMLTDINYNADGTAKEVQYNTSTAPYLSYNAYTGAPGETTDYSAASGTGVARYNYNAALSDENDDVLGGPNFVDHENGDVLSRSFSFIPSLRLMNRGYGGYYNILEVADSTVENSSPTNDDQTNMLYDLAINTTYYEDAASNPRIIGDIDLGAFEYQNELRRVFYVDPFKEVAGTGSSWGNPIGRNGIQDAVNLAALYHANNVLEQAFVFVKGAPMRDKEDRHTGESIILHDGVSIYGSIDNNMVDTVAMKYIESKHAYYHTDDSILSFLLVLDEHDEGQVGPNTFRTAINGIYTSPTTRYNTTTTMLSGEALEEDFAKRGFYIRFPVYSLISGFHVTNKSAVLSPIIDLDPQVAVEGEKPKVAMRKIAVYDNTMADGVSADVKTLARVRNALVYNSLFRDNDAKGSRSVLRIDPGAYAVNVSVQGKTETTLDGGSTYISPYNGHGKPEDKTQAQLAAVEKTNRIIYSIVNYDKQDPNFETDTTLTIQTKYTMSGHNYRRSDRNMYFQLAEGSGHINEIPIRFTTDKPLGCEDFLPQNLRWFVNYQRDRDMMGNPRVLTLLPTDTIAKAHGATAYASGMHLLDRGCFEAWFVNDEVVRTSTGAPVPAHHSPVTKHFAPHTGSVVYVNDNRNLVCGTELQPGFLLLKTGASLYGNGQNVKVSYLSVEREIDPKGSVVSLPFPMDYGEGIMEEGEYITGIARVHYHNAQGEYTDQAGKGGILHLQYDADTEVYEYDSNDRMRPDYTFSATDGTWFTLTDTKRKKNQGVLLVPPADVLTSNSNLYKDDDGDGVIDDDSPSRLIYAFTARGEEFDDMMYEEDKDEKFKSVLLGQYDDTESTDHNVGGADTDPISGADFTSKEDMGWNCIGMPYLVSDYQTFNEASADNVVPANAYAKKAEPFKQHYNMHIPHTLWLYYNGSTTSDGETLVNGDGGFYSVPSWMDAKDDTELSWRLPDDDTPRLWVGEGFFVQTASVTGADTLRFYRPIYNLTGSTGRKPANTRYFVDKDIDEQLVAQLDVTVRHRTVYVRGLQGGEQIAIYDLPGRCYQMATAREGRSEWTYVLPHSGIYLITVDGLSRKVVVD